VPVPLVPARHLRRRAARLYLPIIGLLSPAFLILIGPLSFRLTCYYYRKAYYRSFWLAPVACAYAT